jgi:hypothetical protein
VHSKAAQRTSTILVLGWITAQTSPNGNYRLITSVGLFGVQSLPPVLQILGKRFLANTLDTYF